VPTPSSRTVPVAAPAVRTAAGLDLTSLGVRLKSSAWQARHRLLSESFVANVTASRVSRERTRKLELIRDALAMIVLLWVEHPAHRRDLLRFLAGAALRRLTGRTRRHHGEARVSAWESCLAVITGPSRYFSVRKKAFSGRAPVLRPSSGTIGSKDSLRSEWT